MKTICILGQAVLAAGLIPVCLCDAQNTTTSSTITSAPAAATAVKPRAATSPGIAPPTARTSTQPASQPVEKDGLAVIIRPMKAAYRSNEPLEFEITYQNVSTQPFRLPVTGDVWLLKCTETSTGKTYTGGTKLPGMPEGSAGPSKAIPPGGMVTTTATCGFFGFIEGDLDYDAFTITKGKMAATGRVPAEVSANNNLPPPPPGSLVLPDNYLPPLPPGTYKVSIVDMLFLNNVEPDADPVPVWKGDGILSNPVEITITAPPNAMAAPVAISAPR